MMVIVPKNTRGWETAYATCRRMGVDFKFSEPVAAGGLWKITEHGGSDA